MFCDTRHQRASSEYLMLTHETFRTRDADVAPTEPVAQRTDGKLLSCGTHRTLLLLYNYISNDTMQVQHEYKKHRPLYTEAV